MQCFDYTLRNSGEKPPREVTVGLEIPKGGPYLILAFSLSLKSDLAAIQVNGGQCKSVVDDREGNVTLQVTSGGRVVDFVRFKSWCERCLLPICFQVMGPTSVKKCNTWSSNEGWCLLGQGMFTKVGEVELDHTPLQLEHDYDSIFKVQITKITPGGRVPLYPSAFPEYARTQDKWRQGLGFKNLRFFHISHPTIAVHMGLIPRDLYYWKGVVASNEYLDAILRVGFLGAPWEKIPNALFAERVVFSLTHFINVTVDYQPDMVTSREGVKSFEYFSKGLLRFANKADCEDLAWYMTSLVEAIQGSKGGSPLLTRAREVLEDYIPASAVVQGTAPEFRASKYNLCIKPRPFESEQADQQEQSLMHVFHVTSFLFPKRDFLECVNRGCASPLCGKDKKGKTWAPLPLEGAPGLDRLYCEPTACVGEDPLEGGLTEEDELKISTDQALCIPVGNQSPHATLIYGALIEVITNWFIRKGKGPQCMTFVAGLVEPSGQLELSPEDCHWGMEKFAFIPSMDIRPILKPGPGESYARWAADIPVPWLTTLPGGFEERMRKLEQSGAPLFQKRFFWKLSAQRGAYEHPMREGVWVTPPSA